MVRWREAALILLAGCAQKEAAGIKTDACDDTPSLDWDSYGEGFFLSWCTSCHAATVVGPERAGAPEGLDFDTWEGVLAAEERIRAVTLGENPSMPPLGGVPDSARSLLEAYLDCGLGIAPAPVVSPCAAPRLAPGPVTVASTAEAEALCADAEGIDGALTVSGGVANLDCLCTITGEVVLTGEVRSASFAALETIGGDLSVRNTTSLDDLTFPELDLVEGACTVENTGLRSLALPELATLGAGMALTDNPELATLELFRLKTVGADLVLRHDPALVDLSAFGALESLGGDLSLTSLQGLTDLSGFERLTEAGSVTLASHPGLNAVSGFSALTTVHGSLSVSNLGQLARIDGFDALITVEGDLTLATLPALSFAPRLDTVGEIRGTLAVEATGASLISGFESLTTLGGLRVTDNLQLTEVIGFGALPALDGSLVLTGNPSLAGITGMLQLVAVHGDVQVSGTEAPLRMTGLDRVTTIDGSLIIQENPGLTRLDDLDPLESVGGDLTITDNPALPTAAAWSVLDAQGPLDVGGLVTIEGNGP